MNLWTEILLPLITLLLTNGLTLLLTIRYIRAKEREKVKQEVEKAKQAVIDTEKQRFENLVEKLKTYNIYIEDLDTKAVSMLGKYNELQRKYDELELNYNVLNKKYLTLERKYNAMIKNTTI